MSDRSHAQQAAGQRERERLPQAAVWRRSAAAAAAAPAVDTRLGLCLLRYFRLFRITLVSTPSLRLQIRALQPPPSSSTKERASARPPDARSCCSSILGGLSDTRPFFSFQIPAPLSTVQLIIPRRGVVQPGPASGYVRTEDYLLQHSPRPIPASPRPRLLPQLPLRVS